MPIPAWAADGNVRRFAIPIFGIFLLCAMQRCQFTQNVLKSLDAVRVSAYWWCTLLSAIYNPFFILSVSESAVWVPGMGRTIGYVRQSARPSQGRVCPIVFSSEDLSPANQADSECISEHGRSHQVTILNIIPFSERTFRLYTSGSAALPVLLTVCCFWQLFACLVGRLKIG